MQCTINSKLLEFCPACTREIWREPNGNNPNFLRLFKVKTHLALINIKGIEGYFAGACWHIELKKMVEVSLRLSGWSKNRNQRNTWQLLFSWDVVIISLSVTSKTTATEQYFPEVLLLLYPKVWPSCCTRWFYRKANEQYWTMITFILHFLVSQRKKASLQRRRSFALVKQSKP